VTTAPETTFLFTDIQGSTRLWEHHPAAMQTALETHDQIMTAAITDHGGIVFKTVGDAFCAVFGSPCAALRAATAAQRQLVGAAWGELGPLLVRMALNSGVAEDRDGDYFGPPLNRVARILAAAHGGQILLSQATAELARDHLPAGTELRGLGEHRLKDLIRPERLFQVVAAGLPAEFPSLRSLEAFSHNLPVQLTSFIGREREIAEVKALLPEHRLLTLTGPGGTGKTRLSLQVAADVLDSFADGVWFVELAPLADPGLVVQTIAATLGVREESGRPLIDSLTGYIAAKHLLLVLDNCEHVIDMAAQCAEDLLQACPRIQLLISSREALGIAGERPLRIPSLSVPKATQPSEVIAQSEAVRLFVERARAALPSWTLTPERLPLVAQICARLDGIPLAIELAAARIKVLRLEQVAARLDDRFRLLTGGSRTALPRQQTLRALIDWSYDLLSPAERTLLARLAVFAGGWTLEAAEVICAGGPIDQADVLDLLSQLVNKSLVMIEREQSADTRYRLLETIRQYGREKLVESGESIQVRELHSQWYARCAAEDAEVISNSDHDNLRTALEWYQCRELDTAAGLRFATDLFPFWNGNGYFSEGRAWLKGWLNNGASVDPAVRAAALEVAAFLAFRQDDYAESKAFYLESLALHEANGNRGGYGVAARGLGDVARAEADFVRSVEWYEKSVDVQRQHGTPIPLFNALSNLAISLHHQGKYERALPIIQESLQVTEEVGSDRHAMWALRIYGMVLHGLERYAEAGPILDRAIAICRTMEMDGTLSYPLTNQGYGMWVQGDFARARALCDEAAHLFGLSGDRWGQGYALTNLGRIALSLGDIPAARAHYVQSLHIFKLLGNHSTVAESLSGMAAVLLAEGAPRPAAQVCGAATALLEQIGSALMPADRRCFERTMERLRATLPAAEWAGAYAQGLALPWQRAIDLAAQPAAQPA
jgi:predicted ATPase/class 3 adenylate cyclase